MTRKTKIIATLGPQTATTEGIQLLLGAGTNVFRLNGSHNTLDWHKQVIERVRSISPLTPILMDIPGRKVRTGVLKEEIKLTLGKEIIFTTGDDVDFVPVTYKLLHSDLKSGDTILADDGTLKFKVERVEGQNVHCRSESEGLLKSSKGLNIPYVKLNGPAVTERDRKMLHFAIEQGVDFIGISFVESARHVQQIREIIGDGSSIVAKIENRFGLDNMEEVIQAADAIMIDRGDLSAETEVETLALMQKKILKCARTFSKPVIVATEMLHTMIENPFPTKAEVSDISNAIIDGASAIMLSGETAVGKYPKEAVELMSRVALVVEAQLSDVFSDTKIELANSVPNALGKAVREIATALPITKIVCVTARGMAPLRLSRHRLAQPILAVTNSLNTARKIGLSWGVEPVIAQINFSRSSVEHVNEALRALFENKYINTKDLVIVTSVKFPKPGDEMNSLEVFNVGTFIEQSMSQANHITHNSSALLSEG